METATSIARGLKLPLDMSSLEMRDTSNADRMRLSTASVRSETRFCTSCGSTRRLCAVWRDDASRDWFCPAVRRGFRSVRGREEKGAHDFGEAGEDHGFHVGGDPGARGVDEGDVGCDWANFAQGYASAVWWEALGGRVIRRV